MSSSSPASIHFHAANTPIAEAALARLSRRYGQSEIGAARIVVALGGDGGMLEALHAALPFNLPVFGMRQGSVGFLLNDYREDDLMQRLEKAQRVAIHPLRMIVKTAAGGQPAPLLAINEVSLLRETHQTAKLRLSVDGIVRLEEMICDGVLVATPAGSTAYNLSAHGPILPLGTEALALTPISVFRPRRWRGAVLSRQAKIRIETLEADKRPVSAVADFTEVRDVIEVDIAEAADITLGLLFDPELNLEERILQEQFQS